MKRESLNMCIQNTREQKVKKLKGFTLIELIVTVLIVGVIFAVGVPGLQSLLGNVSLNANADKLVNSLAYARGEAVARVTDVSVATEGAPPTGWRVFIDANANCAFDAAVAAVAGVGGFPGTPAIPAEEILRVVDVTTDNVIIVGDNCIGFNEFGENRDAATSLTVDSATASAPLVTISVSANGYARVN